MPNDTPNDAPKDAHVVPTPRSAPEAGAAKAAIEQLINDLLALPPAHPAAPPAPPEPAKAEPAAAPLPLKVDSDTRAAVLQVIVRAIETLPHHDRPRVVRAALELLGVCL